MSTLAVMIAVGFAMLTCVLIHQLFPGARKQLTVASMKPFGDLTRPRLTIATITEKLLLACRLLLIAALAAAFLIELPESGAGAFTGDVIGIVPGTPQAEWSELLADDRQLVWLDRALTPASSATPAKTSDVADALTRLDQVLSRDAKLSVLGVPSARIWPERMPAFAHPLRWLGGPTGFAQERSMTMPEVLWIVGGEPAPTGAVEQSIELWRQAGLIADTVTVKTVERSEFSLPDDAGIIVWLAEAPPTAQRLDQTIVSVGTKNETRSSGRQLQFDTREPIGVFATSLWHAVSEPGLTPPAEAQVSPLPTGATIDAIGPRTITASAVTDLPMVWVWLLAGVFMLERVLSLRGIHR